MMSKEWKHYDREFKQKTVENSFVRVIFLAAIFLINPDFSQLKAQEIIPDDRRIDWSPGIPGGIPEVSGPIYNVVDYGADIMGVEDSRPAILQAISQIPASGGVVYFPPGKYRIASTITIDKNHVVLRGAGWSSRLLSEANGDCFQVITYQRGTWQSLNADALKGSLTLEVPDGSKFQAGKFAEIEQTNDPDLMYTDPAWIVSWAEQSVGQFMEIEKVEGNTLTFTQPLNYTYTTDLSVQIRPQGLIRGVGFEDLYLEKMVAEGNNIFFKNTAYCWVRNVESYHTRKVHVDNTTSLCNEIRDSYFHRSFSYGGGGSGYGVGCGMHVTNTLVENNVFDSLRHAMIIQSGANGNVYGYNYSAHPVQGDGETNLNIGWDPPDISNHGHYAFMNLFEGNEVVEIGIGDYWGPAGPGNTYFRNRVTGEGIIYHDASHKQNNIANVTTQFKTSGGPALEKLEHGNVVNGATVWDPAIENHLLPESYYHDEKPGFFGDFNWPVIGPDADASNILPARDRYNNMPYFHVDPDAASIGQYQKLEFSIETEKSYENPFDPDEVDVYGNFLSPGGSQIRINGFWDGSNWKLRFSGADTGTWIYSIYLADSSGIHMESGSFELTASAEQGWIRQSASAPHYLELDNGDRFFGIGMAVPWLIYDERYYEQPNLLETISDYGVNFINWLFTSWDIQLLRDSYSSYSMNDAAAFDSLLEDAEEQGVKLMLGIWIHDLLRDAPHPWSGFYDWSNNPFNQLTGVHEFFSDSISWEWQKKYYRYLIARYGHSQAIGLWHTVAEINGTNAIYDDYAMLNDVRGWHNKINAYFRDNDPYRHPTTVSGSGGYDFDPGWQVTDIPQAHQYPWPADQLIENTEKIATWAGTLFGRYEKPALVGEFGKAVYEEGKSETFLHNSLWAGLINGAAATPLHWWGGQIAEQPNNFSTFNTVMLSQLKYLQNFITGVDLREHNFRPRFPGAEATLPYLADMDQGQAYLLEGDSMHLAWVHHLAETSDANFSGAKLLVPELTEGWYQVAFFKTWSGDWYSDTTWLNCESGLLEIPLPDFTGDVAMKIIYTGTEGPVGLEGQSGTESGSSTFIVYPNPMADYLVIESLSPEEGVQAIQLMGINGQVLLNRNFPYLSQAGIRVRLDLPELEAGLYFLRVKSSAGTQSTYKLAHTGK